MRTTGKRKEKEEEICKKKKDEKKEHDNLEQCKRRERPVVYKSHTTKEKKRVTRRAFRANIIEATAR